MQAGLGTIVCEFGGDPAICLQEETIFDVRVLKPQKCPYHVPFDLDFDLGHILDVGFCRFSHLSGRRSDLRKTFTDGQRTTEVARWHWLIPFRKSQ